MQQVLWVFHPIYSGFFAMRVFKMIVWARMMTRPDHLPVISQQTAAGRQEEDQE
jgi:hypothetical protein